MITVSDRFRRMAADRESAVFSYFRVKVKRRYWNGSAYVYEAGFTTIDMDEIDDITPISWKLDSRDQNKILASNVTIRLRNQDWRWLEANITEGFFRPTLAVPGGFDPYKMQVQIVYGYVFGENDEEDVPLFTGLATEYLHDTQSGAVEIFVEGYELKMETADAQDTSIDYVDEPAVPPTGNAILDTFATKTSVWNVSRVETNNVDKSQGTDYKLQKMSDRENAAEIVYQATAIPPSGHAVKWDGRRWLQDKSVSFLIGALCDVAGITSGERSIQEPTFPGVSQFVEYGSQAQWDAAVKSGTNSDQLPGFLQLGTSVNDPGFESGAFGSGWNKIADSTGDSAIVSSITTPAYSPHGGTKFLHMAIGQPLGPVDYRGIVVVSASPTAPTRAEFETGLLAYYDITAATAWTLNTFDVAVGAFDRYFHFVLFDFLSASGYTVVSCQTAFRGSVSIKFYAVNRSFTGVGVNKHVLIDDVSVRIIPTSGTAETGEIDLLATPSSWLPLNHLTDLGGGSISFRTKTASISGGPYSSYVATDGALVPQSPLARFIKVEITQNAVANRTDGPETDYIRVYFLGTTLFVGHADFKTKNCLQGVQRLAEICDCEFGFTGAGLFFFRPKGVSISPVLYMTQDNYIMGISSLRPGYDFVQNRIGISYGNYYYESNADTEGEASPTSEERFGPIPFAKTINDMLFSNNADFASAVAKNLRSSRYLPKRRAIMETTLIPFLELSDVVNVDFHDSPLRQDNVFGDELNHDPAFGPDYRAILRDTNVKLVGISFNVKAKTMQTEIQEVLS